MKKLTFKIETLSLTQKFFIEKAIELLYRGTIDSYRVRVMNPVTILEELIAVAKGLNEGRVKDFKTLNSSIQETISLLKSDKEDNVLIYTLFDVDYFIELLDKINKETFDENFLQLKNSAKIILRDNKDYLSNLFAVLENSLVEDNHVLEEAKPKIKNNEKTVNDSKGIESTEKVKKPDIYPEVYQKINRLTGFLISGLISSGYSKSFLFKLFHHLFIYKKGINFNEAFSQIKKTGIPIERKYRTWFKISAPKEYINSLNLFGNCEVFKNIIPHIKLEDSFELKNFKKASGEVRFISIETNALDYYSGLQKAKHIIAENLDVINLGFDSFNRKTLIDLALVEDIEHPQAAEFHKVYNPLDGNYKRGKKIFDGLFERIPKIISSKNISKDSKEKLKSAIRYLRLGNEAIEIEHKIINYWVGLEYLFSNYKDGTFTRIKEFLSCIQTLIYAKRNLQEYHKNIKKMNLDGDMTHYSKTEKSCLFNKETYEEIRNLSFNESPLLSYRSWEYKRIFFSNDKRIKYLEQHKQKLEQHLIRLYRVRNEIIHEAQYNFNNENLTSNLKYYLVTTLSILIDYFDNYEGEEQISINEFFLIQTLKLDFLKKKKYDLHLLLRDDEDFELLG